VAQPALAASADALLYLEAALLSLAREERQGRPKQRRILDPDFATWQRFRGRLNLVEFVELVLQDGAVTRPYLFAPTAIPGLNFSWSGLGSAQIELLLRKVVEQAQAMSIPETSEAGLVESVEYIQGQARRLGVPSKMARSELPRSIKPQHRVLELPGTGGQLTHYASRMLPELNVREVFTIAAANWQEWTLGGVVAVEVGVREGAPLVLEPSLDLLRKTPFDVVLGLHPDKGGTFSSSSLEQWFPRSKIALV